MEWLKEIDRLRMYNSVYETDVNIWITTDISYTSEPWVSKTIGYIQGKGNFYCLLLIAFLQIGKGWLKFPWTLVVNEIIGKQMRKIMPVFISTPLLNLPKQKLFFYGLDYFSRPSQMIKWDPGKVTLIIREYKTYYIWAAFTSSLH